ncbi:acyl carrier protein [Micromonospora sp. NPDC004704]
MPGRLTEVAFLAQFAASVLEVTNQPLPEDFSLDERFAHLELDSMSRLEVIACLEDRLQVVIDDTTLSRTVTGRDLYEAVAERVAA